MEQHFVLFLATVVVVLGGALLAKRSDTKRAKY